MDAADTIPPSIVRSYVSAVNVYNAREWTAVAVICRRVLEGITKYQMPEDMRSRPLAQQLRDLPSHVNLGEPITTLSDALRRGGNLGAHFDEDQETDQETAAMMLDLLEYLMEYLYALPSRIHGLHQKVSTQQDTS